MSAVARVYDEVAQTYDGDFYNLYEGSHNGVIEQVRAYLETLAAGGSRGEAQAGQALSVGDALDLAGGTGQFWHRMRGHISWGSLTINDASASMLSCARQKLPDCTRFCHGDSLQIPQWAAAESKDFITSHFLFSFLSRQDVFRTADYLLRSGGLFSIATTTRQDLKALCSGRFERSGRLLGVSRYVARANTPKDHVSLGEELATYGFEVIKSTHLTPPFVLNKFEDVRAWALESGWAASYFERFPRLKLTLATGAFKVAEKVMRPLYPITANSDISLYLVRKR